MAMTDESAGTDDNLVAGVEPELQRSTTYSEYERAAIERVLSAVEKRADKSRRAGKGIRPSGAACAN